LLLVIELGESHISEQIQVGALEEGHSVIDVNDANDFDGFEPSDVNDVLSERFGIDLIPLLFVFYKMMMCK
jgi:hypothetical protein